MTVVHFASARDKMRWKLPQCWQSGETAELMRLYAVLNGRSVVTSYEYGETETFGSRGPYPHFTSCP